MTALIDERLIERELGSDILAAAKANNPREAFKLLLARHSDLLMNTDEGALFAGGLAVRIRRETFRDFLARKFGIYLAGRLPAPCAPRKHLTRGMRRTPPCVWLRICLCV
jgi:hypothetical protein